MDHRLRHDLTNIKTLCLRYSGNHSLKHTLASAYWRSGSEPHPLSYGNLLHFRPGGFFSITYHYTKYGSYCKFFKLSFCNAVTYILEMGGRKTGQDRGHFQDRLETLRDGSPTHPTIIRCLNPSNTATWTPNQGTTQGGDCPKQYHKTAHQASLSRALLGWL